MIYQIDTARVSIREYLAGPKTLRILLILPIALLLRLFRVRFVASYDEPPIDSYGPYRVSDSEIETEYLEKLLPVENELSELGFHSPVYHAVEDGQLSASFRMVTLRHDSGQAIARVQFRKWEKPSVPKNAREKLLMAFMSVAADGGEFLTANLGPDFSSPPGRSVKVVRNVSATELWAKHQRAIDEAERKTPLKLVRTQPDFLQAIDDWQLRTVNFQRQRGVFIEPVDDAIQRRVLDDGRTAIELADPDAPVLAEIAKNQQTSSNWKRGLVFLAVTILLFFSLGSAAWSWEFAGLLVPILFFHELGHLAAMRVFKYRNLKMFFIPLFGAAVTGRHYNVPGWKKAIVSLAGPVPGIVLGAVLSVIAIKTDNALLTKVAAIALAINALNLLPILPFDGGWVAHTLFFARHPLMDAGFRLATAGLLLLGAQAAGDRILLGLGIFMLAGIPWAYRLAKVAAKARKEGLDATPTANDELPIEATKEIIREVRECSPTPLKPKQLAQFSLKVIEILNARSPGFAATFALAVVHAGSFVAALVFGVALFIHSQGGFWNFMAAAASRGQTSIACGSHEQTLGAKAGRETSVALVIANLTSVNAAKDLYQQALAEADGVSVTRIGNSVLIAMPTEDGVMRAKWFDWLDARAKGAFVAHDKSPTGFVISGIAPDEATAAQVEKLASEYLNGGTSMHLIPPWAPHFALSAEQVRARATYRRLLIDADDEADAAPELAKLQEAWTKAMRRGDESAAKDAQRRMDELVKSSQRRKLEKLRAEGPESVDLQLIDLYEKYEASSSFTDTEDEDLVDENDEGLAAKLAKAREAREAWEREAGARMGQLPMKGPSPAPADLVYAARSGAVSRKGLSISFQWLAFYRGDTGAVRLLDWLCERGLVDMRYTLQSPLLDEEP